KLLQVGDIEDYPAWATDGLDEVADAGLPFAEIQRPRQQLSRSDAKHVPWPFKVEAKPVRKLLHNCRLAATRLTEQNGRAGRSTRQYGPNGLTARIDAI